MVLLRLGSEHSDDSKTKCRLSGFGEKECRCLMILLAIKMCPQSKKRGTLWSPNLQASKNSPKVGIKCTTQDEQSFSNEHRLFILADRVGTGDVNKGWCPGEADEADRCKNGKAWTFQTGEHNVENQELWEIHSWLNEIEFGARDLIWIRCRWVHRGWGR